MSEIDVRQQVAEGFAEVRGELDKIRKTQIRDMFGYVFWVMAVIFAIKSEDWALSLSGVVGMGVLGLIVSEWRIRNAGNQGRPSRASSR